MISKEQYGEIIDLYSKYIQKYNEMYPGKMTDDFAYGFKQAFDLLETLVDKNS